MICLSFDTDHVDEARMREFLDVFPLPGEVTFFCTQRYDSLEGAGHELCGHPFLTRDTDWDAELARTRREFPAAVGWRSHSCVYSHVLGERLAREGYAYVSTQDLLGRPGIQPRAETWGLWHLPIYYMDNLDFSAAGFWGERASKPFDSELLHRALDGDGLYVFAFHPVHLLLNTPDPAWYLERRERFVAGAPLAELRFGRGRGSGDFYLELCRLMEREGSRSVSMRTALTAFIEPLARAAVGL